MPTPSISAPASPPSSRALAAPCRVAFGPPVAPHARREQATLHVPLPVLAGAPDEILLAAAESSDTRDNFSLFRAAENLGGFAVAAADADLETAAADLYRRLFAITAGLHLHRIWNYVPAINAIVDGLENYRRFCRGRSLAFEERFGREFQTHLPAASAVGAGNGPLTIAFLAGRHAPQHFENPQQVPAFNYPPQYGPRPPSFSRATLVRADVGSRRVFISGTAAIFGHATIAAGHLPGQLEGTIENLRLIGAATGVGRTLGADSGWRRSFKVYLRHADDLPQTRSRLEDALFRVGDRVSYLQADLCRRDLLVEIEAGLDES